MIVREHPGAIAVLFAVKGSVLPRILPQLLAVGLFASLVVVLESTHLVDVGDTTLTPFTLLGIALSLFLGFRNNAAYDRWWEARTEWGRMILCVRALARTAQTLLGSEHPARREIMNLALAYAHGLRGTLRQENTREDVTRFVSDAEADAALASCSPADFFLRRMGERIGDLQRSGDIDSIGLRMLDERLNALASVQSASERISSTPLPFAYTLLVHRTAYVYCFILPFGMVGHTGWATPFFAAIVAYTFFGLDRLSEELQEPFGRAANDLPLDAICRVHEISVAEALGDVPPKRLQPVDHVLQ